jgi:HSP20 family protein
MARRRSWDPVADLVTMQQAMDRLYEDTWSRRGMGWREGERVAPLPLDVYSTDSDLIIKASVPGADPQDVEITIEGETLTIKGEIKGTLDNVDYHLQERRHGPFARTLTLNVLVDAEQAEATFENGELTLTIPKAAEVRPKVIKVKSK